MKFLDKPLSREEVGKIQKEYGDYVKVTANL